MSLTTANDVLARTARFALAGLLLCSAGPGRSAEETLTEWRHSLRQIGDQISAGEFAAAESASVALAREMTDQIVGGAGADLLLAMATTYRALAVAGQGRGEEAIWHWQVAQQLFPRVTEVDLSHFAPEGGFLSMHPPRRLEEDGGGSSDTPDGDFVPPRRLESPRPEFPDGRAFRGLSVEIVVEVVVGEDGRPSEPVIVDSNGEPTLVWSALEALRRWRFAPARRNGVPEPSLYRLRVGFVVPTE